MSKRLKKYFIPHKSNDNRPYFFREISVSILFILTLALLLISAGATLVVSKSDFLSAIYPSVLVDLANESRIENKQNALKVNSALERAAQLKADDMAEKGYFAHNSPEGLTPWYWIGLADYSFILAGENLAVDFDYSKDVNKAWLNSPGHRANILNSNFTEIGIATAKGNFNGHDTVYVVQMFGTPAVASASQVAAVTVNPTPKLEDGQTINNEKTETISSETEVNVIQEFESEGQLLIVAQNSEIPEEVLAESEVESKPEVLPSEASGYDQYTKWYEWIIINPGKFINYILYTLALVVFISLVIMIFVNVRIQHSKNIIYGLSILAVLIAAIYINQAGYINNLF